MESSLRRTVWRMQLLKLELGPALALLLLAPAPALALAPALVPLVPLQDPCTIVVSSWQELLRLPILC